MRKQYPQIEKLVRCKCICLILTALVFALPISTSFATDQTGVNEYQAFITSKNGRMRSLVKNKSREVTGLGFTFTGAEQCTQFFSDGLPDFAIAVAFGALDAGELREMREGSSDRYNNPVLSEKNLSPERWAQSCAKMVEVREKFLGCKISAQTEFPIAIWTKAFLRDNGDEHLQSSVEAFAVGGRLGTVVESRRKPDCSCDATGKKIQSKVCN